MGESTRPGILHSQTLATFGAAALQNQTAVLGGHTCTETVSALAAEVARLKCTFHDTISS